MAKGKGGVAELRKPQGKTSLTYKNKAREELPNGTAEQQAELANKYLIADGYMGNLTADKMREVPKVPKKQRDNGDDVATLDDLFIVKAQLVNVGGYKKVAAQIQQVRDLAKAVGSLNKLESCLDALKKLEGED